MISRGSFQPKGLYDAMEANASIAENVPCSLMFEFSSTK